MNLAIELRDTAAPIDLRPRPHCSLEWWFVHGRYSLGTSRRSFMTSVFRSRVPLPSGGCTEGHAALISHTADGAHLSESWVDRNMLAAVDSPAIREIDPFSPDVLLDEIRRFGLPREFRNPSPPPLLSASPFSFAWSDLTLASDAGTISLAFHLPESAVPARLILRPEEDALIVEAARRIGERDEAMEYETVPRLSLHGTVDAQPVHGDAWMDHQWGGRSWLQGPDARPRGWDWLGFNLEDGSSWIVMSHWDAPSGREFARFLTIREPSGQVRIVHRFHWQPLRWWLSCATRVRHPVAWRLEVPELEADITFTPAADDQELRVFTPQRAIWEGAGHVAGTLGGRPVSGWGRLEGQGRGYVLDSASYLGSWAALVDRSMAEFIPRTMTPQHLASYTGGVAGAAEAQVHGEMLARPLWDLMDRNGKRWRAVIGYLFLDMLGRDPRPIADVICTVPELLHNASLIIDDIQDDSILRRGDAAIHRRYGLNVAISAANTAYFLSLLKVLDHPVLTQWEKQAICEIYQRGLVRGHLGQAMDIYWAGDAEKLEGGMRDGFAGTILDMYVLKTAAPVEALAELAALLSGSAHETTRAVIAFARAFGLAFQLIDDVKNFSTSPAWGKRCGEDLRAGKPTYLILRALEMLGSADRARLMEILCRKALRESDESAREGIALVVGSGARERLQREACEFVRPAWSELSSLVRPSSAKAELRFLWENLLGSRVARDAPADL